MICNPGPPEGPCYDPGSVGRKQIALTSAIQKKQGGFAGLPAHRGVTYAKGTNPSFNARVQDGGHSQPSAGDYDSGRIGHVPQQQADVPGSERHGHRPQNLTRPQLADSVRAIPLWSWRTARSRSMPRNTSIPFPALARGICAHGGVTARMTGYNEFTMLQAVSADAGTALRRPGRGRTTRRLSDRHRRGAGVFVTQKQGRGRFFQRSDGRYQPQQICVVQTSSAKVTYRPARASESSA